MKLFRGFVIVILGFFLITVHALVVETTGALPLGGDMVQIEDKPSAEDGVNPTQDVFLTATPEPYKEGDGVASPDIIGGVEAIPGAWPWQARLDTFNPGMPWNNHLFCGGVLVSREWVLTAAHCVYDLAPSEFSVTLGDHDREVFEGTEQSFTVQRIIVHPNYPNNGSVTPDDLALIQLDRHATLTARVKIIDLAATPQHDPFIVPGATIMLTGWGQVDLTYMEATRYLQQVSLPLAGSCYGGMLCTAASTPPQSGCSGDSGGPMVIQVANQWLLAGIISGVTYPDCESSTIAVRIATHKDWIEQYTNQVGIIPATQDCGVYEKIIIDMDDENHRNRNNSSGWIGAITSDRSPSHTQWVYCRVPAVFKPLAYVNNQLNTQYAVLSLGEHCPNGSIPFERYFDNQDGGNENWSLGNIWPNKITRTPSFTTLKFCLFAGGTQVMTDFPDLGIGYGVLAAPGFSKSLQDGWVHTDDEDNNANGYWVDPAWETYAKRIVSDGSNTDLYLARVTNPPLQPIQLSANGTLNSVSLGWNSQAGIDFYQLYRIVAGTTSYVTQTPYSWYSDTPLTPGITYCYYVEGWRNGRSTPEKTSNIACAIPQSSGGGTECPPYYSIEENTLDSEGNLPTGDYCCPVNSVLTSPEGEQVYFYCEEQAGQEGQVDNEEGLKNLNSAPSFKIYLPLLVND